MPKDQGDLNYESTPPFLEEQEQDNSVTMLKTNQGKDMVENSGFTYTFQKSLKGIKNMELAKNKNAWKCTKITSMKCPARIHTEEVNGVVTIVKRFCDHNHLPKSTVAAVNLVSQKEAIYYLVQLKFDNY